MKGQFGRAAAQRTSRRCSNGLQRTKLRDAADLIRLHEIALFLRAYPQSPRVAHLADEILFPSRVRLRGVDPAIRSTIPKFQESRARRSPPISATNSREA